MVSTNIFAAELNSIQNDNIRTQVLRVLQHVHEKFFRVPASSTSKYHPEYTAGEHGLYKHTCAAVAIANTLLEIDFYKTEFSDDLKDYIRAALILHDCCKRGKDFEYEYTVFEHPLLACDLITTVCGECEFTDAVTNLIKCHMGQWNTSKGSKIVLPLPLLPAQLFVHTCDYLASRKFIEVHID